MLHSCETGSLKTCPDGTSETVPSVGLHCDSGTCSALYFLGVMRRDNASSSFETERLRSFGSISGVNDDHGD